MQIQYSARQVSPWGGLILMKEIMDQSGIGEKLRSVHLPESTSNNRIGSLTIVESFFASVWISSTAFLQTAIVRLDDTLREMFGWERVPIGTTFGRFFKKFSWAENNRVFPELNRWFFEQIKFDNYTLDVDSSVITHYGEPEGGHKGYNPKKQTCFTSSAFCFFQ